MPQPSILIEFPDQSTEERTNKLKKFNDLEFLERHKLQKLTQEEINNMDSPICIKGIKFLGRNLLTKETPSPGGFNGEFYHISRESTNSSEILQENWKGRNYSQFILKERA